jgi:hypothetical protein
MAKKVSVNIDAQKALDLLEKQAEAQQRINGSMAGYLEELKKLNTLNKTILDNRKLIAEFEADAVKLGGRAGAVAKEKARLLREETLQMVKQGKLLKEALSSAKKFNLLTAATGAAMVKNFAKIESSIINSYNKLDGWGLWKMDKAIKTSALSMGVLSKQTEGFRGSIKSAALDTTLIGIGIEELSQIQSSYSEELGRTVMLNKEGLVAMGQMAAATSLGAEGASKLAADFENQGISAERTAKFVEETMDDAHKMGLNASKVIKNIQGNFKMLNKYNFKGGAKGLAKMAETVSKLGVDMNFAAGMAEKLFDIEGAVDMSAQLQVMGGEWSKLADPFKLMYMARNDMEGLTAALGKAAESSVHFNEKNGEFEISALEMHKLRKVAEQTGVSYEELAQAGKNAAKFTKLKKQMSFGVDKETEDFLASTAQLDEKGNGYIKIGADKVFLNKLTRLDRDMLTAQAKETADLKTRAEESLTFDEALKNTTNMFKSTLLPLIEVMNQNLLPKIKDLVKRFQDEKWGDKIGNIASMVGKFVSGIGGFILEWPKVSASLYGLMKVAPWILNGVALGKGFLATTKGFMGGPGESLMSGFGKMSSSILKLGGQIALAAGVIGVGMDLVENFSDDSLSTWDATMKTLKDNAGKIIGGVIGGAIGSLAGPGGTAVGAGYGMQAGGMIQDYIGGDSQHDAIFNSPIHDGYSPSSKNIGSDFSKGRGIVEGGKITPIDNKDSLLAYKPNGPVDNKLKEKSAPKTMKIEFGEIKFKFDDLIVKTPGGGSVNVEILKDPHFIRNLTTMIHVETQKVVTGGKVKG